MSERDIARGQAAERLLSDPLMVEALDAIKENVRGLFFELGSDAAKEREFLHLMDRARQQFENVLKLHLYGLQVARNELMAADHAKARLEAVRNRRY